MNYDMINDNVMKKINTVQMDSWISYQVSDSLTGFGLLE